MFISRASKKRYRDLKTELLNDHSKRVNNWSTSVDEVVQLSSSFHIKKQTWAAQMMQTEMALAQMTTHNQARGNGGGIRAISLNIICPK